MGDLGSLSLNRLANLVTSPVPLLAGIAMILVVGGCAFLERRRWISIGLLLFVAIPSPAVDFFGNWMAPPAPLDQMVIHARSATAMLLALLAVVLLVQGLSNQDRHVPRVLWWFLAMQVLLCLRHIVGGNHGEATGRLGVYVLVFLALGVGLSRVWSRGRHLAEPFKAIVFAAVLYALANSFIMVVAWDAGFRQSRWFGITGNPNHAGRVAALFLPAMLAVASFRGIRSPIRWGVLFTIALLIVQTMLTGSRGAILTCLIGVAFYYRVRLGRMLLAAVPLCILTMIILSFSGETGQDLSRLTSTQNTRGEVFAGGLDRFLSNPMFGSTGGGFFFIENGYLAVAMHTGILGVGILIGLTTAGLMLTLEAVRARSSMGSYAPFSDAAVGGVAALAASNMVEATLLANLSQTVFVVYLYAIGLQLSKQFASEMGLCEAQAIPVSA